MWNINFIDENPSELLKLAHSAIKCLEGTDVKWLSSADVKKKYKKYQKSCSFIFSSFEGNTYEYLKDLKMTIFGPQLLLDYLRSDDCLPKVEVPLFSSALKDAIICFSAFSDIDRENLSEKIEMMHGTVIKDLTLSVKVLVSTNVGTKKVRVAIEKGIPVVLESWIHFLWSSSAINDPIDGLEAEVIDKYRIPVFYNLKICLSGLTTAERLEAENIITKNGGEYCRDLTVGHCTHLITKEPTGKKYHYALKWRIQIVNCKWLADSILRGYSVDETEYPVSNKGMPVSGSTPIRDESMNNFNSSEYSAISQSGPINETRFSVDEDDRINKSEDPDDMNTANNGVPPIPVINNCSSINDVDFDDPMTEEIIEPRTISEAICPPENLQFLNNYLSDFDVVEPINPPSNNNNEVDQEDTVALLEETKLDCVERVGVFGVCRFTLAASLVEDERKTAETLIVEHGGSITTNMDIATHIIAPPIGIEAFASKSTASHVVTVWYLQACAKSRCLLKCTDDFLYEPVSMATNGGFGIKPLEGTVLSFSGYPSDERKLLKTVASALGAAVQDKLARRAIESRGILATTHLVIGRPDRTKLPSCRAWGVPAVSKQWLGACAVSGRLISVEQYEVLDGGVYDHNMSIMSTCTVGTVMNMSIIDGGEDITPHNEDNKFKTPPPKVRVLRNPLLNKVRETNVEPHELSMGELNSPIMRIAASDYLTAPRKIDIGGIEALKTPEHFEPRRGGVWHTKQKELDQSITSPDISKALQARLAMLERGSDAPVLKDNGNQHGMDTSFLYIESRAMTHPLAAVVVYVAQSMHSQQLSMKEIIERLGGEFSWIYDHQVTHVICSSMSESARCREELLAASKAGKVLVSCDWLRACDFEKRRVDESIYVIVPDSIVNVSVRKRKVSPDVTGSETSTGSCKSAKLTLESAPPPKMEPEKVGWHYKDKSISRPSEEDSQLTQLSDSADTEMGISGDIEGRNEPARVIMLHSVSVESREVYEPAIRRLGADLENADTAMSRVTHVVCSEPGRNAKYLSAIAAGLWVVHTSYIDDSIEAGRWLDESRYEWGGPCTAQFLAEIPRKAGEAVSAALLEHEASLAEAARRLRQLGGGLAFRDWRVCILDVPAKASKFAMIIEAGGGIVMVHQPLPAVGDVTHFLVSKTFLPGISTDVAKFPCYKVDLISYFLAARNEHENKKIVKKFLIPSKEVISIIKSGGDASITGASRPRRSRRL